MTLLEVFATDETSALGPTEMARRSGLPKSTVVRLLNTLQELSYVWRLPGGLFVPGPGLLQWGGLASGSWRLSDPAFRMLQSLRDETGETVNVYVRQERWRVGVAQVPSLEDLRHIIRLGERQHLTRGAASKVLLAYCPDSVRESIFSDMDGEEVASREGELEDVRRQGFAVSHSERVAGVSGVYVPVLGAQGLDASCALGVAGPSSRFMDVGTDFYLEKLGEVQREFKYSE